ncbi:hypothetical protein SAMN02745130_00721 [Thiothrix eikelboomii]|uniref:Pyrroline-5-carboxylate reductase catalytic N-terminal domain-containing protein n=1 Tax=Thiothrix eikelboomii TaxID=92487 RepID=A0A1T4VZG0_9GAMM|nr:NADPH-dependent F420 reductase [Thiothrix eikelboomii]SKA70400.1 hypothetical protein SAMN02745130_00721 [Thiothrix eikelboomii]
MKIALIGAGNVGQALAKAIVQRGEVVIFGVQEPVKYEVVAQDIGIPVMTVTQAVAQAEMVILAVPYAATASIARSIPDWQGKILVDATNPLASALTGLSVGTTDSGAETLARHANNARVVKAFNTTGAENMANSHYSSGQVFMPVCGDDVAARQQVIALATLLGFDAVDMGGLQVARYLEPFAMTWIHLAILQGYGRNFAFGLLRRG